MEPISNGYLLAMNVRKTSMRDKITALATKGNRNNKWNSMIIRDPRSENGSHIHQHHAKVPLIL